MFLLPSPKRFIKRNNQWNILIEKNASNIPKNPYQQIRIHIYQHTGNRYTFLHIHQSLCTNYKLLSIKLIKKWVFLIFSGWVKCRRCIKHQSNDIYSNFWNCFQNENKTQAHTKITKTLKQTNQNQKKNK